MKKTKLKNNGTEYSYYNLKENVSKKINLNRLPKTIKILLENVIRNYDGRIIKKEHLKELTHWGILEKKGEGLHHIKEVVADCQKVIEEYKMKGIEVVQSGKFDEDEFYYLDTEPVIDVLYEIGNSGKIRPPERRYP